MRNVKRKIKSNERYGYINWVLNRNFPTSFTILLYIKKKKCLFSHFTPPKSKTKLYLPEFLYHIMKNDVIFHIMIMSILQVCNYRYDELLLLVCIYFLQIFEKRTNSYIFFELTGYRQSLLSQSLQAVSITYYFISYDNQFLRGMTVSTKQLSSFNSKFLWRDRSNM